MISQEIMIVLYRIENRTPPLIIKISYYRWLCLHSRFPEWGTKKNVMETNRGSIAAGVSRRSVLRVGGSIVGLGIVGVTPVLAQGKGASQSGKFTLDGTAEIVNEPDVRPTNHVVRIDTSEDGMAGNAVRSLGDVQAADLNEQLGFRFYVVEGDSGGGSPRIVLSVDNAGDGTHDGYIHGHADPQSTGTPGAQQNWNKVDLTDDVPRWETAQLDLGLGYVVPYSDVISNLNENHEILSGFLVDDSWWKAGAAGITYYDDVQIGDRTLSGNGDVVGRR